ncbi:MAG: iron-containing alcohol dehydrogenase [Clostridia bacterium]|nr:iron-containing alcohol dehydrogenase [Clostridia bacterium]
MKSNVLKLIDGLRGACDCGLCHDTAIRDIRIASGLVHRVGEILKENGFPKRLLLVADENTLKAADGILESLSEFEVELHLFPALRVAEMCHVEGLEEKLRDREIGVLSVGTGSVNDPCRLAAARQNKPLCIFATAPSMDGFASYGSPIVAKGFKCSYDAKSPEVIIGDTRILAESPSELKSAGFGDMIAKYVGLVDWQISSLLTGERYCEKVATLTREAVDELLGMADLVTERDEATAGKIFEALLKTGVGMSFMKNSRPASGAEHVICHLLECVELQKGIIPNYHGDDVGVATLELLRRYGELAELPAITAKKEQVDWDAVFDFYGPLASEAKSVNFPDNIIDAVSPEALEAAWPEIRRIIRSVPDYETCRDAMARAGCRLTVSDIGKDEALFRDCVRYSPFMRRRLTLLRMHEMIEEFVI